MIAYEGLSIIEYDADDTMVEDTMDDMAFTINRQSGLLLSKMALILKDKLWVKTTEFCKTRMASNDWQDQIVFIAALGATLDGPTKQTVLDNLLTVIDGIQ